MRFWLVSIPLLLAASPLASQELASVETSAYVRIPDFLSVKPGDVTEAQLADGMRVRRVTLRVTANRRWTLQVVRACNEDCSDVDYRISSPNGKPGTDQQVEVEFVWGANQRAPTLTEFEYLLTGS
jgi:hypothetical protein